MGPTVCASMARQLTLLRSFHGLVQHSLTEMHAFARLIVEIT
jgi:hypothetical protein